MKPAEWLERADAEDDEFGKFTNAWMAFNSLYAGSGRGREIERINVYLRSAIMEDQASKLLEDFEKQIGFLTSKPVIDLRENGGDTKEHINVLVSSTEAIEKLLSLFAIIYQVRCNLLHGQKSPSRKRDKRLCHASNPIIVKVVSSAI